MVDLHPREGVPTAPHPTDLQRTYKLLFAQFTVATIYASPPWNLVSDLQRVLKKLLQIEGFIFKMNVDN